MKTTKNGIGASNLRWVPRHLVKAFAAAAVLVAAALPLALATEAGAATPALLETCFTLSSSPGGCASGYTTPPAAIGAGAL